MYKYELVEVLKNYDSKLSLFSSEDIRITMLKSFLATKEIKSLANNSVIKLDDFYRYLRENWRKKSSKSSKDIIDELFNDAFLNSDNACAGLFRFFIEDNNRLNLISKRYYYEVNNHVANLKNKNSATTKNYGIVYLKSVYDSASKELQWQLKHNIIRIGENKELYSNLFAFLHKKNLLDEPALLVQEHVSGSIYGDEHILEWDYFFKTLDRFGKLNLDTVTKLLGPSRSERYIQLDYASIFDDLRQSSILSAKNLDLLTNVSNHNIYVFKQVIKKLSQRGILTDESFSQIIKLSEKIYKNLDHQYADQYMLQLAYIPIHLLTPITLTHFIKTCEMMDCKTSKDLEKFREEAKKSIVRLQKAYDIGMAIGILDHTPLPADVSAIVGSFFKQGATTKGATISTHVKTQITSLLDKEGKKTPNP